MDVFVDKVLLVFWIYHYDRDFQFQFSREENSLIILHYHFICHFFLRLLANSSICVTIAYNNTPDRL